MNGERPRPSDIGDLQRSSQGIEKQPRADAATLPFTMDAEAREDEKRNRKARHPFSDALRRVRVFNFAHDERIESDHAFVV